MTFCNSFGCRESIDGVGVLLAQLGTPDAPTKTALRRYLKQFLSDPRVIELNRVFWWCILNGIILNTRPKRSAALYKRVWRDDGSPLLATTRSLAQKLEAFLRSEGDKVTVRFGMRYGSPSLESAITELIDLGCRRILLLPLYPQYAGATSASTYDAVFPHILKNRWVPTLRVAAPFFNNPAFLQSVAQLINMEVRKRKPDRLILSYHGVPQRYVDAGDPYCCMCTETTEALKPLLEVTPDSVIQTFQSRFGKEPWLVPYTDVTLKELAESGVKNILVACPGFTIDCLETLDEIGTEGRALFLEHGGESLTLVPCLNDHELWVKNLAKLTRDELGGWLSSYSSVSAPCPVKVALSRGVKP